MAPLFIFTGARWCDSLGTGLASMMELCSQIFTALQSPELVARFQKFCGVEGHDTLREPKKKKEPRSVSKSCPQVDDQNNCAKCVSHSQFDLKLNKIMNELNGVGAVDVVQNGKVVTDSASVLTKRHPENERTLTVRTPCTHLNENGLVHRNGYQKLSRDTGSDAEPDDTEDCAKDKELTHGELTTDVTNILEPEHWTNSEYDYSVKHKSLYYLFKMASAVGNETFFTIFFPYVIWNVDSNIGRQMSVVWFYIMYVGQATKDMIKLPRPASPPVVRLEKRYEYEYGMPSTHAMIGAAFPFGLLTLMQWRYPGEFWFGCSFAVAVVWMLLVATSRLYMGMHTVLDVLAGLLFTGVVLPPLLPVLGYIDQFSVTTWFSPLVVIPVTVTMCLCYPRLDRWSTTRGDTTVVMSTSIGVLMATWLDFQLGRYHDWETPPPYHFSGFDREQFLLGLLRFFLGSVIVALTRMVLKPIVIRGVCAATGTDPTDVKAMQQLRVELPYKYISYCGLAFVAIFISNNIFLSLGITRPTYFTEIL